MKSPRPVLSPNCFDDLSGVARKAAAAHALGMAEGVAEVLQVLLAHPKANAVAISQVSRLLAEYEGTVQEPKKAQMH